MPGENEKPQVENFSEALEKFGNSFEQRINKNMDDRFAKFSQRTESDDLDLGEIEDEEVETPAATTGATHLDEKSVINLFDQAMTKREQKKALEDYRSAWGKAKDVLRSRPDYSQDLEIKMTRHIKENDLNSKDPIKLVKHVYEHLGGKAWDGRLPEGKDPKDNLNGGDVKGGGSAKAGLTVKKWREATPAQRDEWFKNGEYQKAVKDGSIYAEE